MIYKPWHRYSLHPGTNQGNTLSGKKQAVVPVPE
jgi:hypothetical protein